MNKSVKSVLKNRFILVLIGFLVWMIYFDQNSWTRLFKLSEELKEAERQERFYENEIRKDSTQLHELETNKEYIKKFAREEYRMKKDDETIFLIIKESEND